MKFDAVYVKRLVTKQSGSFFIKKCNMTRIHPDDFSFLSFLLFVSKIWAVLKWGNFVHQCACSVCVQFPLDRYAHLKEQVHITELKGEVHLKDYSPQFWLFSPLACKSREFTRKSAGAIHEQKRARSAGWAGASVECEKRQPPVVVRAVPAFVCNTSESLSSRRCTELLLRWFLRNKSYPWFFLKLSLNVLYWPSTVSNKNDRSPCSLKEMWWASLTPFVPVLVLITCVIHPSTLHFAVAGSIVY